MAAPTPGYHRRESSPPLLDGARILLFRACAGERAGVTVTDTAGSYRTWIADGFGPDWNPARVP